jgi:hypothetical protein
MNIQFDDMRMPQHFKVLNLSLDPSCIVTRLHLGLVDEFQRDLMSGHAMFSDYSSAWSGRVDLRLTLPNEPVPSVRPTMY